MPSASCRCCQQGIPAERPRVCPECGHVFKGNGWDGIDAHLRAKHEQAMTYGASDLDSAKSTGANTTQLNA